MNEHYETLLIFYNLEAKIAVSDVILYDMWSDVSKFNVTCAQSVRSSSGSDTCVVLLPPHPRGIGRDERVAPPFYVS